MRRLRLACRPDDANIRRPEEGRHYTFCFHKKMEAKLHRLAIPPIGEISRAVPQKGGGGFTSPIREETGSNYVFLICPYSALPLHFDFVAMLGSEITEI